MIALFCGNSFYLPIADHKVHLVVFSPPYYGLRQYQGVKPLVYEHIDTINYRIENGDRSVLCNHEWTNEVVRHLRGKVGKHSTLDGGGMGRGAGRMQKAGKGKFCKHCGAWKGYLGQEPTVDLYVQHLIAICREIRRVLHPTGSMWINLGFSYAAGGGTQVVQTKIASFGLAGSCQKTPGYAPKQLIPIPWLVGIALQQDGWWLRSPPPWLRFNQLPESVTDRPTRAHEYWLMLTPGPYYYYDREATRRPQAESSKSRARRGLSANNKYVDAAPGQIPHTFHQPRLHADKGGVEPDTTIGRQLRTSDFWFDSIEYEMERVRDYLDYLEEMREVGGFMVDHKGDPLALIFSTVSYKGAHFATYNWKMIVPIIQSCTSEYGVCPVCGSPWVRQVVKETKSPVYRQGNKPETLHAYWGESDTRTLAMVPQVTTIGWRPSCTCHVSPIRGPVPCPDCDGSGEEYDTHAGKTDASYDGKSTAGRLALLRQAAREAGGEYTPDFVGLPTGRPCPTCEGEGTILGDVWPDELLTDVPVAPSIVLDPFVGSGSTLEAIQSLLNRDGLGLDLSPGYLGQARARLGLNLLSRWEKGEPTPSKGDSLVDLPLFEELSV